MTCEPLWLFADQIGPHVHSSREHRDREVVLVESTRVLRRKRFHRQKVHLVLSGMRHLADELGDRATYLRTETYREALEQVGRPVVVHEPTSHAALAFVERLRTEGLVAEVLQTPTFALSRAEFTEWAGDRETFRMEDFYRAQRRRFDVLMAGGEPVGGRWNYDHENREPQPKGKATLGVPAPWQPTEDAIDEQVRADLDALDLPTIGRDGPRWFAVTAAEGRRALTHFVQHRLPHFGPPEDAMLTDDWAMAHSLLSVPLNLGVLHPLDVVREAESAYPTGDVPLPSAEGLIRQVLGRREYMWHLYWHFGRGYLRRNALRAHTRLPDWWTGAGVLPRSSLIRVSACPATLGRVGSERVRDAIGTAARLGLAAVFLISGVLKAVDPDTTYVAVRAYDVLPKAGVAVVATVLPWLEIALGLLLLAGVATRVVAVVGAGLLLVFIAGVTQAWARGLSIDCGCFGGGGAVEPGRTTYGRELLRDLGFLLMAGWLVVRPRTLGVLSTQRERV